MDNFNHFRSVVREVIHLNEIHIFQIQIKSNYFPENITISFSVLGYLKLEKPLTSISVNLEQWSRLMFKLICQVILR